jgi:hypothetical protein
MDLVRIAARVAAGGADVPGGMAATKVVYYPHWDENDAREVATQFGGSSIGASPYGEGFAVEVPAGRAEAVLQALPSPEEGHVFGSWEEVGVDEDAFEVTSLNEEEEDPGPPSDPGPPWDTHEERKGLK